MKMKTKIKNTHNKLKKITKVRFFYLTSLNFENKRK